jgi:hypothetical protein
MTQTPAIHESFARDEGVQGSSDRVFGLVVAGVFLVLALLTYLRGHGVRWWSLWAAVAFSLSALLYPRIFRRLNWFWLKVGLLLHAIVNPVVMGLLFYLIVTPIGLVFRWLGNDPLRLRFDRSLDTYWIERRPPGPSADTMPRQF